MANKPAPLDLLREKLDSRNQTTRIIALRHAAAHGATARPLAAKVASMFEDESPAVQLEAVYAFRNIGPGARDAVPVLLRLRAKGAPPMLVDRATFCLGWVGAAASEAVAPLKAAFDREKNE